MPVVAASGFSFRPVSTFGDFADHVRSVLDRAPSADLVVLPELMTAELFTLESNWESASLDEFAVISQHTGSYLQLFTEEAARRGQHILAGSQFVADHTGVSNVAHLFGPGGLIATHAKTHCIPPELASGVREGTAMEVVELPFGKVAINICYEVEFPECAAAAVEQGALILLNPSMTFTEAGAWRVRHCAHARAVENQIYVITSQISGPAAGPFPGFWGWNGVLGPCDFPWAAPDGVLSQVTANTEACAIANVSITDLERVREAGAVTTFRDRRRTASVCAGWPTHLPAGSRRQP